MNWKLKAAVQRACAALPIGGRTLYFSLQRTFGLLGDPERPMEMLGVAADLARELRDLGFDLRGKRVLEVGTGWRIDMPIGLYLCGAASTVTYDLHRYLRPRLVMEAIAGLAKRRQRVLDTFAPVADAELLERRLDALLQAADFGEVQRITRVEYSAPADATRTGLPDQSVDLHLSFTVLQHIPYPTLVSLLREASRVLKPNGLAWHHVDLSDQFAQADPSISRANFLRFTDHEWARYSDNQFAYHNRLRVTDYERLYADAEHDIIQWKTEIDERSRSELLAGFPLAPRFRDLPVDALATDTIRAISRPRR